MAEDQKMFEEIAIAQMQENGPEEVPDSAQFLEQVTPSHKDPRELLKYQMHSGEANGRFVPRREVPYDEKAILRAPESSQGQYETNTDIDADNLRGSKREQDDQSEGQSQEKNFFSDPDQIPDMVMIPFTLSGEKNSQTRFLALDKQTLMRKFGEDGMNHNGGVDIEISFNDLPLDKTRRPAEIGDNKFAIGMLKALNLKIENLTGATLRGLNPRIDIQQPGSLDEFMGRLADYGAIPDGKGDFVSVAAMQEAIKNIQQNPDQFPDRESVKKALSGVVPETNKIMDRVLYHLGHKPPQVRSTRYISEEAAIQQYFLTPDAKPAQSSGEYWSRPNVHEGGSVSRAQQRREQPIARGR